jgi:hypothetical protein
VKDENSWRGAKSMRKRKHIYQSENEKEEGEEDDDDEEEEEDDDDDEYMNKSIGHSADSYLRQ